VFQRLSRILALVMINVGAATAIILTLNLAAYIYTVTTTEPSTWQVDQSRLRMFQPNVDIRHGDQFERTNASGFRKAPWHNSHLPKTWRDGELKIAFFGGSAAYGASVGDGDTIPAHLEKILGSSVRVINFGQGSYSMHQEAYLLVDALIGGARPDLIIFYDGNNETNELIQNIRAGVEADFVNTDIGWTQIEAARQSGLAEGRRFWWIENWPLTRWLVPVASYPVPWILNKLSDRGIWTFPVLSDQYIESYADAAANRYFEAADFVEELAEQFEFQAIFVFQPITAFVTDSRCIVSAGSVAYYMRPAYMKGPQFFREFYPKVFERSVERQIKVHDLSDVFNDGVCDNEGYFTDSVHLTASGNKLVATHLADIVRSFVEGRDDLSSPN